jgi:hypothetical protein
MLHRQHASSAARTATATKWLIGGNAARVGYLEGHDACIVFLKGCKLGVDIDVENIFIGLLIVLALVSLAYTQLEHLRKVKSQRGALFDQVQHLLDDVSLAQDSINYPTLRGSYLGYPIKLEPIVDTTVFRKLPVLWLLVTYYRPLPIASPVDILLRPTGSEFFSPNATYVHSMAPGSEWPEHIRVSSPAPAKAPPLSVFRPFVPFISDPLTKEVLVTSKGIRVVHQIAEGDQTHYRVTRGVELDTTAFTAARLRSLLLTLREISDALAVKPNL